MLLVHRNASEAALPKVSGALLAGMDGTGIAAMKGRQRPAQAVLILRGQDQVNMVGHEDPRPDVNIGGPAVLREQVAIEAIIGVAEEGLLAAVATLSHMMGEAGKNGARKTGHGAILNSDPAKAGWRVSGRGSTT